MELHRIFVGGLFPSVTRDELRDKFKSFGNVSDVTLVQRKDDDGHVAKTFGYINLSTSTQQLNKCFALFGGTKWKRYPLKVQLAKENFIKRLEKERKNPDIDPKKSRKRKNLEPVKSYYEIVKKFGIMKKAVPGTLIEGEKDWVVGKYGRLLPVVSISKRTGKKPLKYDPSKHCHCLRKITCDDDNQVALASLTWSLDGDGLVKKKKTKKAKKEKYSVDDEESEMEVSSPKHKKKISKKKSLDERKSNDETEQRQDQDADDIYTNETKNVPVENGSAGKQKHTSSKRESEIVTSQHEKLKSKDNEVCNEMICEEREQLQKNRNKDISVKRKHTSDRCFKTKIEPIASDSDDNDIYINRVKEIEHSDSNDSGSVKMKNGLSLSTSIVEQLLRKKEKMKDNKNNHLSSGKGKEMKIESSDDYESESEAGSDESEEEANQNLFDFNFESLNTTNNNFTDQVELREVVNEEFDERSKDKSFESSQSEEAGSESDGSETEENYLQQDQNLDWMNSTLKGENSYKTELTKCKSRSKDAEKRHALSEEARRKSLEVRNKKTLENKELVKNALKNIDGSNAATSSNRIVFNNDESGRDNDNEINETVDEGTFNIKKSGLWNAKDESSSEEGNGKQNCLFDDDQDNEGGDQFKVKPQFQGEKGEKLFKMQQRFRGDERFKLDERFAAGDENDEDDKTDEKHTLEDIESSEKVDDPSCDLQLEKERNLSLLGNILGKSLGSGNRRNSNVVFERYDPGNIEHEKYEIKQEGTRQSKDSESNDEVDEEKQEKKEEENKAPEISGERFYEVDQSIKKLFGSSDQEQPLFSFLGESGDQEKQLDKVENEEIPTKKDLKKELSWQKALDETKRDVSDDEEEEIEQRIEKKLVHFFFTVDDERFELGKSFARTESVDEITKQWKAIRSNLNEDYKKKHKDAVRRVRKLKEKRFSKS